MYYTVYKITNLINNKIYIGVHKTNDINDDYMGSGKYLKRAQEKYGMENFRKEILEVFNNTEDMFNMESLLVNEDFVKDKETYNLKLGGEGGWSHLNNSSEEHIIRTKLGRKKANDKGANEKAQEALKWLRENDKEWLNSKTEKYKQSMKKFYENGGVGSMKGKKHSEKSIEKMKGHTRQTGSKNSQFGTMWIHNLEEKLSKKIKKDEFETYENLGWNKGKLKEICNFCNKKYANIILHQKSCKIKMRI